MPVHHMVASVLDGRSPNRPQGSRTDSHDNSPRFSKALRLARALLALPDRFAIAALRRYAAQSVPVLVYFTCLVSFFLFWLPENIPVLLVKTL